MKQPTKRRSYHLPHKSIELLEIIAKHYAHGSLTSALAGCVQHVYMTIPLPELLELKAQLKKKAEKYNKLINTETEETNV